MIQNRQKKVRLRLRPLERFLLKVERELGLDGGEVAIALVSDSTIAGWNRAYRRKTGATDVLSFPVSGRGFRRSPEARSPVFLGDIAIAPETARRFAKKNRRSLDSELRILILHGILHLLGYDHEKDQGQMNRIEQRLRRRLGLA
jgi:probable rRNA maturation factor